jgi:hypothetical protein
MDGDRRSGFGRFRAVWSGVIGYSLRAHREAARLGECLTQTRAEMAQAKEDGLWLPLALSLVDLDEELLAMSDLGDESRE